MRSLILCFLLTFWPFASYLLPFLPIVIVSFVSYAYFEGKMAFLFELFGFVPLTYHRSAFTGMDGTNPNGHPTPLAGKDSGEKDLRASWEAVYHSVIDALRQSMSQGMHNAVYNTIRVAYANAPADSTPAQLRAILERGIRECMTTGLNRAVENAVRQAVPLIDPSHQPSSPLPHAWAIAPSVRGPLPTHAAQDHQGGQGEAPGNQPHVGAHSCPECEKTYNNRGCWYEHVRQHHIGLTCFWPGCGQTLANREEIIAHIRKHYFDTKAGREAHTDGKAHCCWGTCQKAYAGEPRILRHIMEHQVDARRSHDQAVDRMYVANIARGGLAASEEGTEDREDGEDAEDEDVEMES